MAYPPDALLADPELGAAETALAAALWRPIPKDETDPCNYALVAQRRLWAGSMLESRYQKALRKLKLRGWVSVWAGVVPNVGRKVTGAVRLHYAGTRGGTGDGLHRNGFQVEQVPPHPGTGSTPPRNPVQGTPEQVPPIGEEETLWDKMEFSLSSPPTTENEQSDDPHRDDPMPHMHLGERHAAPQVPQPGLQRAADPAHGPGDRPRGEAGLRGRCSSGGDVKRRAREPSAEAIAVAQYLYDAIREHTPTFCSGMQPSKLLAKVRGWALQVDVGLRNDGMTLEGCKTVIDVAHRSPDTFWRDKFGSGKKVRDKYEDFLIRAKQRPQGKQNDYGPGYTSDGERLDQIDYGNVYAKG